MRGWMFFEDGKIENVFEAPDENENVFEAEN